MLHRRHRLSLIASATAAVVTAGILSAVVARAATACRIDYEVTNQWQGGFGANVTINNLGDPVTSWTVTWSYTAGQQVTQAWNATVTLNTSTVSATNVSYNGSIATGGTTSFGFNGTWNNSTNPAPTNVAMNGVACTGTPPTSQPTTQPTTTQPPTNPPTSNPTTSPPSPGGTLPPTAPSGTSRQVERLNRGLISVRTGTSNVVSWRLLGTDPGTVAFNLYRGSTRVNSAPITGATSYLDSGAAANSVYTVRPVVGSTEYAASEQSVTWSQNFLDVPLQIPPGGTTPSGEAYTYSANDASVGDVDGDGQYEIILKWDPSNSKDNSQSGYTGNVYVDAYRLNGSRLWRIDLGRNIRAGAHYTQFQVYDYDGDGRAEVAMKTADGTRSGTGQVIGSSSADHRNSSGYILTGPEYLTVFNGLTGAVLATTSYEPGRGTVSSWGDSYGNRVDRFLAGTAYLDGRRPSLVMARGYYTRAVIVAWDYRNGSLTRRWTFDSNASGNGAAAGQGNHNLSIADVDADGRDEIVYGSATINDNGTLMYTGYGHGDALHVGDFVPSRSGLEVFTIHEPGNVPGADLHDARTGSVISSKANPTGEEGPGRGVAADVYAGNAGAEYWGAGPGMTNLFNASGASVGRTPSSANFLVWWDGDPVRELLDQTRVDKYGTGSDTRLLTGSGVASNNGTKATPALSADLFGDWREEVIWRTSTSGALRIYTTTNTTDRRIPTLMHDPQYRVAIAWQNTAYNQPPHPSFFIGNGMSTPPAYNVYTP